MYFRGRVEGEGEKQEEEQRKMYKINFKKVKKRVYDQITSQAVLRRAQTYL